MATGGDNEKAIPEDVVAKLTVWNESIQKRAEKLITEDFPRKVLELATFFEGEFFKNEWLENVKSEASQIMASQPLQNNQPVNNGNRGKKRKHEEHEKPEDNSNDLIRSNKKLKDIMAVVKPKIKQLVEDADLIKLWIILMIPKIEDGNNFGVSVQEDILEDVRSIEAEAAVYYEDVSKYHSSRAKIVSKIIKYPNIEDYRDNLLEHDEKQWLHMKLVVNELRNHYHTLYDIISKNWKRLICPRSSNTHSMF